MALAGSFGAAHNAEAQAGKGLDASAFADILPRNLVGGCRDFGGTSGCLWSIAAFSKAILVMKLDTGELAKKALKDQHTVKLDNPSDILRTIEIAGLGDWGQEVTGTTQGYNITKLDPSGKSWEYDITKLFAIDFARDCYGVSVAFANSITVPHDWGAGPFPENSAEAAPDPETVRAARALAPALDKKLKDIGYPGGIANGEVIQVDNGRICSSMRALRHCSMAIARPRRAPAVADGWRITAPQCGTILTTFSA